MKQLRYVLPGILALALVAGLAFAQGLPGPGIPPIAAPAVDTVSGFVIDSVSGKALLNARVTFYRPFFHPVFWLPQFRTDSTGFYRAVLDTGTYRIYCQPPMQLVPFASIVGALLPEWYDNAKTYAEATPVVLTEGTNVTINFALVRYVPPPVVHLSGTVSDSSGSPLKGAWVLVMRTIQELQAVSMTNKDILNVPGESVLLDGLGCMRGVVWKGLTDSSGAFNATLFGNRSYVALAVKPGYMPQFYDHKDQPADATILTPSADTSGIDFNLNLYHPPQKYAISGSVVDSSGTGVPSRIIAFPLPPRASRSASRFAYTDSLGVFTLPKVAGGKYLVLAIPFGGYAPAFYKAGAFGVMRWKDADTVNVEGDVNGVTIGVVPFAYGGVASLTGTVRADGQGVEGINVYALASDGSTVGYGLTDGTGAYAISGLTVGTTTLVVDGEGYDAVQQSIVVGVTDYALTQDFSLGVTASVGTGSNAVPLAYTLRQNYPNPFNPSTTISYQLSELSHVTLTVYDVLGREVETLANGVKQAGQYTAVWNAARYASGVYFYRLQASSVNSAASFTNIRKMVLVK